MMTKRNTAIDLIKAIAALFVVILHVNGYTISTHGMNTASTGVKLSYYLLEGTAYCAVDVFIIVCGYLMSSKDFIRLSRVINIWLSTLLIGVAGCVFAVGLGIQPSLMEIIRSILPISSRAYGFVTSYVILILFCPYINMMLNKLDDFRMEYLSLLLLLVLVILPTLASPMGWQGNYTALFFCLYSIGAVIKRKENELKKRKIRIISGCLWAISTLILICSPFAIKALNCVIYSFEIHEEHFYGYNNIVVVIQSIGLFLFLLDVKTYGTRINRVLQVLARNTLVIYIYHMHPILKERYIKWGIMEYLYSDNPFLYIVMIMIASIIVYFVGAALGMLISVVVNFFSRHALLHIKESSKIQKICSIMGFLPVMEERE